MRLFKFGAKEATTTAASESSDVQSEVMALRQRVAALEASLPLGSTRKRSLRQNVKLTAFVLCGAALAGASIVYGQSAVEAFFIRQDGNVGIGTNNPASRLTVIGNASIGTETAAPPNGLRVQGDTSMAGKLDVSGAISAPTVNVAGAISALTVNVGGQSIAARVDTVQGIVNGHTSTLASHQSTLDTLNRKTNVRTCFARRADSNYIANCAAGEVAVGGGGRCGSLWRTVESYPIAGGSADSIANGVTATGWRHTCQIWGDNGSWGPPSQVYAICCSIN